MGGGTFMANLLALRSAAELLSETQGSASMSLSIDSLPREVVRQVFHYFDQECLCLAKYDRVFADRFFFFFVLFCRILQRVSGSQ